MLTGWADGILFPHLRQAANVIRKPKIKFIIFNVLTKKLRLVLFLQAVLVTVLKAFREPVTLRGSIVASGFFSNIEQGKPTSQHLSGKAF